MTQQPWEPPVWVDPKVIWEPPEYPGVSLVHITNPTDLVQWGAYMGHSGGRYQHWAIDVPIWAFLTFLDPEGWPHVTIHLKDAEWFRKWHPDDRRANMLKAMTHIGEQTKSGKAKWWPVSTAYEDVEWGYERPVMFNNLPMVVMGAGHRDRDELWPGEKQLVDEWYNSVVIPGSEPYKRQRRIVEET